jgi:2-polyprenyl-3-methyl-5-hydroxy-6-metoxy-1,4-benzoquinol methylase
MNQDNTPSRINDLVEEAKAFDRRIGERTRSGFIPDLRRSVKCEYFYKSFWREPYFIKLYLGWILDGMLELLRTHCRKGDRILDVGCGAGYMSLEFARNGYNVVAIDISEECIKTAQQTLADNPYRDNFGSLAYDVLPFEAATGEYDIVMFCVSMHHMSNVRAVVDKAYSLLPKGGHLLCYEPCHERFGRGDAAQVALIRGLMSIAGFWYEPAELEDAVRDENGLSVYVDDVWTEYVLERDKNEPGGQSPHDLASNGEEILAALRSRFREIAVRPGCSFIYRLIGGLRGPEHVVHELASFISTYEHLMVKEGYLNPNMFYFMGRKE